MAVYTEVGDEELQRFIAPYDIGEVVSFKGIAEGVENSNYLVVTQTGTFVLTLYEKRVAEKDLPFFIALMEHLAAKGIACPTPIRPPGGEALSCLAGRPAALISFLEGIWIRRPGPHHCRAVGTALAGLHLAGADFGERRPNALGPTAWAELAATTAPRAGEVAPNLAEEIAAESRELAQTWPEGLPCGVIHADLFPDNVFFIGEALSGLIDFYFACNDAYAYDVAICLNAWCFETDGAFNVTKARALLGAYDKARPLSPREFELLPVLARGAALRFLLTRLYDWLNPPEGALVKAKNPLEYLRKLRFHRGARSAAEYGLNVRG